MFPEEVIDLFLKIIEELDKYQSDDKLTSLIEGIKIHSRERDFGFVITDTKDLRSDTKRRAVFINYEYAKKSKYAFLITEDANHQKRIIVIKGLCISCNPHEIKHGIVKLRWLNSLEDAVASLKAKLDTMKKIEWRKQGLKKEFLAAVFDVISETNSITNLKKNNAYG